MIQEYINFERKLDELCELYFEYKLYNFKKTYYARNTGRSVKYIGKILKKDNIFIFGCSYSLSALMTMPPEYRDWQDEAHPEVCEMPYFWTPKDCDGNIITIINEKINYYTEELKEMRLRDFFEDAFNEGFKYVPDHMIHKGKSSKWNSNPAHNFNYHFILDKHTYDVWGFNNKKFLTVNLFTDGDKDYKLRHEKTDKRQLFGAVIQCVLKEVEKDNLQIIHFAAHEPNLAIPRKERDTTVYDLYDSSFFRNAIKNETDFEYNTDYSEGTINRLHWWIYTKKKGE